MNKIFLLQDTLAKQGEIGKKSSFDEWCGCVLARKM
jgi:hypothetical protein